MKEQPHFRLQRSLQAEDNAQPRSDLKLDLSPVDEHRSSDPEPKDRAQSMIILDSRLGAVTVDKFGASANPLTAREGSPNPTGAQQIRGREQGRPRGAHVQARLT